MGRDPGESRFAKPAVKSGGDTGGAIGDALADVKPGKRKGVVGHLRDGVDEMAPKKQVKRLGHAIKIAATVAK